MEAEGIVTLIEALDKIRMHCLEDDCDHDCMAWAVEHAEKAFDAAFGTEDWTRVDFDRFIGQLETNDQDITDEMVDAGARALVYRQSNGCVSWDDTDDTDTSGDAMTRGYALEHARACLEAALGTGRKEETND